MLRKHIIESQPPLGSLLDSKMLLISLRRHFQTLDGDFFPTLARHFLGFFLDGNDLDGLSPRSLRLSLTGRVDEDLEPTAAHCRYTMLIDPTDSEVAVDLQFTMNLFDQSTTCVISLSDFPDDHNQTKHTAILGQIKTSIEKGQTLVLINSSHIQSALYDVINKHHVVSVSEDSQTHRTIREQYAQIAMGSILRCVKIHPNFRFCIHIPESSLHLTPLPFLNRVEKYKLSVRDALQHRVLEMSIKPPICFQKLPKKEFINELFNILLQRLQDFVNFIGGETTFYGFSMTETIPALLLAQLGDGLSTLDHNQFKLIPLLLTLLIRYVVWRNHPSNKIDELNEQDNAITEYEEISNDAFTTAMIVENESELNDSLFNRNNNFNCNATVMHNMKDLIQALNFQLLVTVRPECLFHIRKRLPQSYLYEYLNNQEHFSGMELLKIVLISDIQHIVSEHIQSFHTPCLKLVVYTRRDSSVLRFGTEPNSVYISTLLQEVHWDVSVSLQIMILNEENYKSQLLQQQNNLKVLNIIQLSSFKTGSSCEIVFRPSIKLLSSQSILIIVVADMKVYKTSQLTFARHVVDSEINELRIRLEEAAGMSTTTTTDVTHGWFLPIATSLPAVIFLLHIPSDQLVMRPCYQTIPSNDRRSTYIDDSFKYEKTSAAFEESNVIQSSV